MMIEEEIIEKKISPLVETMFPEFYMEHGPTFVEFVKQYYSWMEGIQEVSFPINKGFVSYSAKKQKVYGKNTFFLEDFESGYRIGLYYDKTDETYELFTIDSIESNEELTLTLDKLPSVSAENCLYGYVKSVKNPNYHIRRIMEYDDVDKTPDEFIVYFKEKYLKNIQFTTKTNTRQLIKHCLDLYRSKGTPRSLDLLFRLVFGVGASVYLPSEDIFKLSDGEWYKPKYLELSLNKDSVKFVNKQIVGQISGATAFAEAVIRRTVGPKIVDVLYMSAIKGDFITGERINTIDFVIPSNSDAPVITGSLTEVDIQATGTAADYEIGDVVDISSNNGIQAQGIVTNITKTSGYVEFEIINGGYAYTSNSEVVISDKVLVVNNISQSNTGVYFNTQEKIEQPIYDVNFVDANGLFINGETVYFYHSNGSLSGNGIVISQPASNVANGIVKVSSHAGIENVNVDIITTTSNATFANISIVDDKTAIGETVGIDRNISLIVSSNASGFIEGERVYQVNSITGIEIANGIIERSVSDITAQLYLRVVNVSGSFHTNSVIYTTNSSGNITNIQIQLGVLVQNNDFVSFPGNFIIGMDKETEGTVVSISQGAGANFDISPSLAYSEDVTINTDFIKDYANIALDSVAYGFPGDVFANISSTLVPALTFDQFTIGKITKLVGINKGTQYNMSPIVYIKEPLTSQANKKDVILQCTNVSSVFSVGEVVTQEDPDSRGLVKFIIGSNVHCELLRFKDDNQFVQTSNSTTLLIGEKTGTTAEIINIFEDKESNPIGFNAIITSETVNAIGAITQVQIVDSGFDFYENEQVTITGNNRPIGYGTARLGRHGEGNGFYKQKGGFLSDSKKLFDGLYYQEYSYEVRSSIVLEKYEEMLKQILHIPGTKYFAALMYDTVANANFEAESTKISQS